MQPARELSCSLGAVVQPKSCRGVWELLCSLGFFPSCCRYMFLYTCNLLDSFNRMFGQGRTLSWRPATGTLRHLSNCAPLGAQFDKFGNSQEAPRKLPGSCQETPRRLWASQDASRSLQESLRKIPRRSQEALRLPRRLQEAPRAPRGSQEAPRKPSGGSQTPRALEFIHGLLGW